MSEQQTETVTAPEVSIETKIFSSLDEAKANAVEQNGKLPTDAKATAQGKVFIVKTPVQRMAMLYVVAVSASRARDVVAVQLGITVELAEPKRKPKPTLVDVLATTGGSLTDDELAEMKRTLKRIEDDRKRSKTAA